MTVGRASDNVRTNGDCCSSPLASFIQENSVDLDAGGPIDHRSFTMNPAAPAFVPANVATPAMAAVAPLVTAFTALSPTETTGQLFTTPLMGGVQTRTGENVAWIGGKPLVDWSGLDPSAQTAPMSPKQLIPNQTSVMVLLHEIRTKGFKATTGRVFIQGGSLSLFEMCVVEHLVTTGLDSIS